MAKRGKNKNRPPKIDFEIEEDADQIFRDYVENMGDIPEHEVSAPEEPLNPSKSGGKSSSKRSANTGGKSIDLHGMTLKEAIHAVDRFIASIIFDLRGETTVKIITGKGRHSGPDGAVLPGGVHQHVKTTWRRHIVTMDDSPEDVAIAGLPIRGHFDVRLKS